MKRSLTVLVMLPLTLVACVGEIDGADSSLEDGAEALASAKTPGYVALGDSVDFGVGASTPANAYVTQFKTWLEAEFYGKPIDHLNLAVPGATSAAILNQVSSAGTFNAQHPGKDKVITVGSGGNDLLGFINSAQFAPCATGDQPACQVALGAVLANYASNLDKTFAGLRQTADVRNSTLLARTQYNGFLEPACSIDGAIDKDGNVFLPAAQVRALIPLAALALEGSVQDPKAKTDPFPGLNDIMRTTAKKYGARVVDIAPAFLTAVQRGQSLIIRDCVHPNDTGHDLIVRLTVDAFEQ